ncbi:MAG: TonB-dependent receptor domain-containing protein, partial [Terriglobia bacterium]
TQNLFLLDGVPNGDLSGNPQGVSGNYIGAETVQEFQIVTNNYSAEYKSVAGAIVSAITKSGTNTFHGSGFWTLRNDNVDAAKWEDNALGRSKPEFKRNQFGGSLGGPVIRDKTFFFGSFEGLRERKALTESVTLPSPRALQGFYLDANDQEQRRAPDPGIVPYLGLYQQLAAPLTLVKDFYTSPGDKIESAQYAGPLNRPVNSDFVALRMDHQLTSSHLLSGTYNWDDSGRERRDPIAPVSAFTTDSIRHTISSGLTSILSPTILNEFNFGYSDFDIAHEVPSADVVDLVDHAGLKFRSDVEHIGQIQQNWGNNTNIGYRNESSLYKQRVLTFKDGLSVTRGNHSMRMGGELNRHSDDQAACSRGCNGIWRFNSWDDFLRNRINRVESFVPTGLNGEPALYNPPREVTQALFAGYFQDNWRILPSLTLNLGLRYEYMTNPKEAEDRVATMRHFFDNGPSTPQKWQDFYTPLLPTVRYSGTINELYSNPTGKSFSPRVGFAWAPGDQKLSIRGGIGIFYDFPTIYLFRQTFQEMAPFAFTPQVRRSQLPAGVNVTMGPNVLPNYREILRTLGLPAARFMEYDQKNATMYRWSLSLQREVGEFLLSAGYTGSRAHNLTTQYSGNIKRWDGWPNNPTGPKHFSPGAIFVNPSFGEMRVQPPSVGSTYHGVALGAQKRLSRGLQFQASYNLSKAIDQGAGSSQNSENLPQGLRSIYYFDQHMNRGLSLQDIRNSLVANFSYDLPRTSFTGAAGQILNGWQINGILSLIDGHPLMIEDASRSDQETLMGFVDNLRPNLIPGGSN